MEVAKGLAGVVVDTTAIADVQSEGVLSYRGVPIDQLVTWPFAEVVALLLGAPTDVSVVDLSASELRSVRALDPALHPMRVLMSVVPLLEMPRTPNNDSEHALHQGTILARKLPVVLATHLHGKSVALAAHADYARSVLATLRDVRPVQIADDHAAAFNTAQVLQLEHSFNAGTFAARVVASTLADVASAVVAGFAALSGPLHGGADQAALEMIDKLHSEADMHQHLNEVLRSNQRLPGMGHREYRVRDPRAIHLEQWAELLTRDTPLEATFDKLKFMERAFQERMQQRGKDVHANVEYYKGLVYRALGVPDHYFTAAFGLARVYGYLAHFVESRQDNRIYRPQARYVGRLSPA